MGIRAVSRWRLAATGMAVVAVACGSGGPDPVAFEINAPLSDVVCGREEPCEIFEPTELTAVVGSEITLTLRNSDAKAHNLVVINDHFEDSFDLGVAREQRDDLVLARTADLVIGETESVTVTFDEPGTYQFYCDLPAHFALGMTGTITVEET